MSFALESGIAIQVAGLPPGTLGLIATDDGIDRWLVTCWHVLVAPGQPAIPSGTPVLAAGQTQPVARLVAGRGDRALDVIAARVEAGVDCRPWIKGLGSLAAPLAPARDQRLVKVAAVTGRRRGVVFQMSSGRPQIRADAGEPGPITAPGDSGGLWVEAGSLRAVALHTGKDPASVGDATGVPIVEVLTALGLTAVISSPV